MQSGVRVAIVVLGASLASGCSGAQPRPEAPNEGLPLRVPAAAAVKASAPIEEPEPAPPAPGEAASPCPLRWTPHELRASVFTLPAELHGRMMVPLYAAVCACTRPGQSIALVTHMVPEHGEVTAKTADRSDQHARASRSIDACLARELGAGRYEPFHIGSDVVCDPPPKRAASPRAPGQPAHLPPPRHAGCVPEEEQTTTIVLPLYVDRRDEY